jgi:hypothetical protein
MKKALIFIFFLLCFSAFAQAQLYYNIVLLSPVENSVYYLGEKVVFRVEVAEAGNRISGASVSAELPNKGPVALSERNGIYEGIYSLKWDDAPGKSDSRRRTQKGPYKGERNFSIQVNPVKLIVGILSPSEYMIRNETVEVRVIVSYPDGSAFIGNAYIITPYGERIMEYRNGIFYHSFPAKDGFWSLKANASDGKNFGYAEKLFIISRKSAMDIFAEHWHFFALPILAVSLAIFLIKFPNIMLARLKKKEKNLKELIFGIQKKYFKEKAMKWDVFRDLQIKHKTDLENIQAEISELEMKDRRLRGYVYRKMQEWRNKNAGTKTGNMSDENKKMKSSFKEDAAIKQTPARKAALTQEKKMWEDTVLEKEERAFKNAKKNKKQY